MDKDITPLHLAAKHNQIEVLKFICENVQNVSPKIPANFELYEDSLTLLTFAMNRANVKVAKTIENCAQKKFSDHALSFLGFTILGLPCFFLFSVVIVIMIAHLAYIYPEDCEEVRHYPSKE